MTPRVSVLPAADRDIDGQAEYLMREASLETALRFYDATAATFDKLARMPGMGERRESSNPHLAGLRVWRIDGFPNHLLFYRPVEGGIRGRSRPTLQHARARGHRPKSGPPSQDHLVSPGRRRGASLCDRDRRERLLPDAYPIAPDACDQGTAEICLAWLAL